MTVVHALPDQVFWLNYQPHLLKIPGLILELELPYSQLHHLGNI